MFGLGIGSWIKILAVVFIVAAVGGAIYAAKSYVEGLNDTITEQQEQIASLQIDNEKLRASNQTLENEISRRITEAKEVREELERLREADQTSRNRLTAIQKQLQDYERQNRIERIRGSSKASLLLRFINKNVKCYVENFDRFDGKCIQGKWVRDGERFDGRGTTPEETKEN